MKNSNKNTIFNRIIWRKACNKVIKKYPNIKLNDFYVDLLRNGHKSKYPRWKVEISIDCCLKELQRRQNDKLAKSKAGVHCCHK